MDIPTELFSLADWPESDSDSETKSVYSQSSDDGSSMHDSFASHKTFGAGPFITENVTPVEHRFSSDVESMVTAYISEEETLNDRVDAPLATTTSKTDDVEVSCQVVLLSPESPFYFAPVVEKDAPFYDCPAYEAAPLYTPRAVHSTTQSSTFFGAGSNIHTFCVGVQNALPRSEVFDFSFDFIAHEDDVLLFDPTRAFEDLCWASCKGGKEAVMAAVIAPVAPEDNVMILSSEPLLVKPRARLVCVGSDVDPRFIDVPAPKATRGFLFRGRNKSVSAW